MSERLGDADRPRRAQFISRGGSSLWPLVRPQLGLENRLFIAIVSKHRGERWDGVGEKRWDDLDSVSTVLSVGYIVKEIV